MEGYKLVKDIGVLDVGGFVYLDSFVPEGCAYLYDKGYIGIKMVCSELAVSYGQRLGFWCAGFDCKLQYRDMSWKWIDRKQICSELFDWPNFLSVGEGNWQDLIEYNKLSTPRKESDQDGLRSFNPFPNADELLAVALITEHVLLYKEQYSSDMVAFAEEISQSRGLPTNAEEE